jgi:hypothetical protein
MSDLTVNISGTFSEKQRPNNGMERVGPYLNTNRLIRVPVVAFVEWYSHGETRTGEKMAVSIPAIEPGITATGGVIAGLPVHDGFPTDAAGQIMWLLDSIRRSGGKGAVADTLFGPPPSEIHRDDDDELEGQQALPLETRLGADGEHVVPPPSGEEIMAERAEAAEAETAAPSKLSVAGARASADLRRRVTGSSEVPVAAFSAPDGGDAA